MNRDLLIGRGPHAFRLPIDFVTLTQAILARKRSGKSYTASVQAEELLGRGQQIVVIDPTSAWWGLRASADGEGPGHQIVVFGGDHADAPLDFRAGRGMAAAVVEYGFSVIFDVGNLHTDEQVQFVMDFCSELLRINKTAMHLFMDEADTFAPQKPTGVLQNKCLGTVSRLVKQGGIKGIGFTMITQRSASINWGVLSQIDILTILRMSAPHDLNPVRAWLQSETTKDFAEMVFQELPRLPIGTAFVASAALNIAERVNIRERLTFNSGATPKAGECKAEPKVMAQVDIEKLGQEVSASVQRAKEESPEYLKRRIAGLEAATAKNGPADKEFIEAAQAAYAELDELREKVAVIPQLEAKLNELRSMAATLRTCADQILHSLGKEPLAAVAVPAAAVGRRPSPSRAKAVASPTGLSGPAQRILEALGRFHAIGVRSVPRIQVCLFSGYGNVSSTGFVKALGSLRTGGLVETTGDGGLGLTREGVAQAPAGEPIRNNADLHKAIFGTLGGPEVKILGELIRIYPQACTREHVMKVAHYSNLSSTGFVKALGRIRSLGYADYPSRGEVVATSLCFLPKDVQLR